ncbi:hypothetical protein UlMin_004760 [Ulmus minor]
MGWFSWLYYLCLFVFHSHALKSFSSLSFPPPPPSALCHPDESFALLQFKNSFVIDMNNQFNICSDEASTLYPDYPGYHVLGYNPKTAFWNKSTDCCSWDGVTCDKVTGHVIGIDLGCAGLRGVFPSNSSLFLLQHLQSLILSFNDFKGSPISSQFDISYLSKLVTLDLSRNNLIIESSCLERTIRNLTKLENLIMYKVNMSLVVPDSLVNFSSSLKVLNLHGNRLQGRFPENIFLLPNLQELDLSYNNKLLDNNFIGQLPNFCDNSTQISFSCHSSQELVVGNVPITLETLFLDDNLLNGTIPSSLFNLPCLSFLFLDNNQFSGSIEEFNRSHLFYLSLANNKLEGHIPRSMFKQQYLISLDLSSNNLSGAVDFEQFLKLERLLDLNLSSNQYLSLSSNNFINYTLSHNLHRLAMSSCNLSLFPHSLRTFENLTSLDLSHNQIKGNVPEWLSNAGKDSLYLLDLSHNLLTNIVQIPWKNLLILDLRSNLLQGYLPIPPLNTIVFSISNNQLTGEIPSLIGNMNSLQVLDLSENRFHGTLPACIENLQKNSTFAEENSNCSLGILDLNRNRFEGSLPQTLLNCKNLKVLDLGNNQINDTFPYWLESLPILQVLILKSNKFHGSIPNPKVSLPFQKLRIMDLSYNEFDGLLPTKYFENFVAMMKAKTNSLQYIGKGYNQASVTLVKNGISIEFVKILSVCTAIDFSRNKFEGEIPNSIGELKLLKGLNFSQNKLAGPIPPSLGKLSNLEWLDLSSNELVGGIPLQLADFPQLGCLNLSQNKLVGMIPQGKQFNTFSNDSYSGNLELCGFPL